MDEGLFRKRRPFLLLGMTNKQLRIVFGLMALNALTFVVIFIWVATNYRMAADDLHHLVVVKQLGVWDAMVFYYQNWNPRWSSILVSNFFLGNGEKQTFLTGFHISSIVMGFVAIWSFLQSIKQVLQLPFSTGQTSIIALYLLGAAFYISFSKDDSWFWVTVNPMYLWGTFAALLGGSLLLQTWNRTIRNLLIVLLFFYAGGSSESVAICTLIALMFVGFKTKRNHINWLDRTSLHLATIACMIGFGISMIGPGIQIRREHLPKYPFQVKLLVGMWNYVRFNLKEIPLKIPLLILFVTPFGFFGRKQLQYQLISIKEIFRTNKTVWIFADLTIAILALALGMVMCEMGPTRTWLPLTGIVLMIGVILAYQLGTWIYIKTNGKLFHLVIVFMVVVFGFQLYQGIYQIPQTTTYANAVDKRMHTIENLQSTSGIMALDPLPDSGWLYSAEITTDTAHFTNKHLGLFINNGQQFVLKEKVSSK